MTPKNEIIKIIKDSSYLAELAKGVNSWELSDGDLELVAEKIVKKFKL